MHSILKAQLREHPYKIQGVAVLQEEDYHMRMNFCQQMRSKTIDSREFLEELIFSKVAPFHIGGKVNHHSCHIWLREKPQEVWQHARDSPKLNV